jgi:hypothetical protein
MAIRIRRVEGAGRKKLSKLIFELDGLQGTVGWDGRLKYKGGIPIARIATQNEYGNAKLGIPPRPFFRPAVKANQSRWRAIAKAAAMNAVKGSGDPKQMIKRLVKDGERAVKQSIRKVFSPILAYATKAARIRRRAAYQNLKTREARRRMRETMMSNAKISKPLIDTGRMLKTLKGRVIGKRRTKR